MTKLHLQILGSFIAMLYLLVPFSSATSTDVKYCDKKNSYDVKVGGLDISPYPISRGVQTTFKIAASTDKPISGGQWVIDVYYIAIFGIHVATEKHDLCEETSCPILPGDFVIAHTRELPGYTPPGSYSLKMTLNDADGKQLTCISFDFSIWLASEGVAAS